MTKHRALLCILITVLLAAVVIPAQAAPAPKEPTPKVGARAGAISALLPVATITRGTGKAAVTNEAKKGDDLAWNDLVKTLKGGRARITLQDQSILSMGAQSELRIVKHDARSQQTALALGYGRLRAEVTKIARQGGSFELKTPTAVAGVIGTDFGTDASSVGTTTFLCISGQVQVANVDPSVAGSVQCMPGMTTSVAAGKPPTIPTGATQEQIQKLMEDTEPALIAAMSPASSLPGVAVDATITGTKMAGVKNVNISGSGVTASLVGTPTDTSVTVHLVIDASAGWGPRSIHLTKQSGADSAAVFNILAPPTTQVAAGGDPKKSFHDTFEQERQAARAGLGAFVVGAQQAADQALQQLQLANQNAGVDLTQATTALNGHVAAVQKAVDDGGAQLDSAKAAADGAFDAQYQTAYNALLQRNPAGAPDDTFNQAVLAIFNQVNATLASNFNGIRGTLAGAQQTAAGNIAQTQANWTTTIGAAAAAKQQPPTPKVNGLDRSFDLGAVVGANGVASLDASTSTAANGASIASYKWGLCPANNAACTPILTSTTAEFGFPTCSLAPGEYVARVNVTDSNNQSAFLDVKVHLPAPTYSDPATVLLNLGQAYENRNVNLFLSYFDQTSFAGFTALQENVRNTFPLLGSMSINPVISQANISCNDATVRADWNQKYYYKEVCTTNPLNPAQVSCVGGSSLVFSQSEQLSVRLTRTPGKGWLITDFQGDNGKVQGQLPGPSFTDNPQPDMEVSGIYPTYAGLPDTTSVPVPPGPQSFSAVVTNTGGADLSAATNVRFSLQDTTGAPINVAVDVPLSLPLKSKESQVVSAVLTVPANVGQVFTAVANVNPGCTVTEAHCDANNIKSRSLFVGTPVKLAIISTPLAFLSGGPSQTLQVSVSDAASVNLALPTGFSTTSSNPQVIPAGGGTATWVLSADFNAAVGSGLTMTVTANASGVNVPLSVPYSVTGPTFMTPTQYPIFIAGSTTPMPVLVCSTLPVKGVTLNMPAGFNLVSGKNPQDSLVATGAGCAANANNVLVWTLTASLSVAPTSNASMTTVVGQFTYAVPYEVMGPVMTPSTAPALIAGSPYAQALTIGVSQAGTYTLTLPAGISASGCIGSTCPQITTSAGALTWNLFASFGAAPGTFTTANSGMTVSPGGVYSTPIPYSVTGPTWSQASTPSMLVGEASKVLTVNVSVPGTYQVALPTGIVLDPAMAPNYPQTQTATGTSATLQWYLQADFSSGLQLGNNLSTTVTAMNASNFSPYTYSVLYSVNKPTVTEGTPPALLAGGAAQTLSFTTNASLSSFMLNLPSGISIISGNNPQTAVNGTLTWNIQASTSASLGAGLPITVTQMNGATPSQYSFPGTYSVGTVTYTPVATPALIAGGVSEWLTGTVNDAGTYTLNLPGGFTLDPATTTSNPLGQTVAAGGTVSWKVQADLSVAPTLAGNLPITHGTATLNPQYSVAAPTFTETVTPAILAGITSSGQLLRITINSGGSYSLMLPTGMSASLVTTYPLPPTGGTVDYYVTADLTASSGSYTPSNSTLKLVSTSAIYTQTLSYTVTAPTATQQTPFPSLIQGGSGAQLLSVNLNVPGSFTLSVPSGVNLCSSPTVCPGGSVTQTAASVTAGVWNVSWYLQATTGATLGSGTTNITAGAYTFPVSYSVNALTLTQGPVPTLIAGGPVQALTFTTNDLGTFSLSLPPGITAAGCSASPCVASSGGTGVPYNLTWDIQADFSAASGTSLATTISHNSVTGLNANYNVVPPTFTPGPSVTLVAGGTSKSVTMTVNVPGTYTLGSLPSGVILDPALVSIYPQTQTISGTNTTMTWYLAAGSTAPTGSQTATVTAMNGASPSSYWGTLNFVVSPPGAPTESTVPTLISGGMSQPLTLTFQASGTYSLVTPLPTGVFIDTNFTTSNSQTVAAGSSLTWYLYATTAATPGTNLNNISVTNGTLSWPLLYNVTGVASYVITSAVIPGHTPDANGNLLGAQGFQTGETVTENVTVYNQGNADGTGTIKVVGSCTGPTGPCPPGPVSAAVNAPAAGQSVAATLTWTQGQNDPKGNYTGSLSLIDGSTGSPIPLATPFTASYDVVDFTLTLAQPWSPSVAVQDLIVGSTGQISATLSEQGPTTPFAIPVTISPAISGVTYSPSSANVTPASPTSPAPVNFSLLTTVMQPPGQQTITLTATNHGVQKTVTQVVNLIAAGFSFASGSNLLLNDASNPLVIQVNQTAGVMLPVTHLQSTISPSFSNDMLLVPHDVSPFTSTISVLTGAGTQANSITGTNATFDWQITANGPTSTVVPLQLEGRLLNSSPTIGITFTLYVKAVGVPDLQVVSVTPSRPITSANPWLAGEAIDFQVVVSNNSGSDSAGNEQVTMMLDHYQVDNGVVTVNTKLSPSGTPYPRSTTINVHAVAPDASITNSANTLKTKVEADAVGDMNYNNNILNLTVPTANWHIVIPVAAAGSSDGNALAISVGTQVSTTVQYVVDGNATPSVSVSEIGGATTTGVQVSDFNSWTLSASVPSTDTVYIFTPGVGTPATLPTGYGYAQVIAQMKDGATVTAQRQATVHLVYGGAPGFQPITVAMSPVNFANSSTPLRLNGPLAQRFTFTPDCGACTSGTADLTFNDAPNTSTTPTQFLLAPMKAAQTATVSAALDANGEVMGPLGAVPACTVLVTNNCYGISATGAAMVAGRRGSTSPAPVGTPIPLYVNVGDIQLVVDSGLSATYCANVIPGGSQTTVTSHWDTMGSGFNAVVNWQITPATGPVTFDVTSGSASSPYSNPVTVNLSATQAYEGLLQYVVEATISNGVSSATKYFPFYVDASTAQNFCGATLGARGSSRQVIKGTWSRSALTGTLAPSRIAARAASTSKGLPDLHITASDVSFTPSMPKVGEAVQVRFRVSNQGNADAVGVPIALQINGTTVAIDTFSVAAGRTTLAGLQWNGVLPAGASPRMVNVAAARPVVRRPRGFVDPDATPNAAVADRVAALSALVVIDPQHTIQQKTTLEKSAPLAHFSLRSAASATAAATAPIAGSQRILLEIGDGACVGLRLDAGSAGPCGSSDAELNVDDKGGLSLSTLTGIADLGSSFGPASSSARLDPARLSGSRYVSQTAAFAGHSYAVQLSGGRTAVLTVVSVRNPGELDAKARALFRANALRVLRKLGGATDGPIGPGEVAGVAASAHTVFVELVVQTQ